MNQGVVRSSWEVEGPSYQNLVCLVGSRNEGP